MTRRPERLRPCAPLSPGPSPAGGEGRKADTPRSLPSPLAGEADAFGSLPSPLAGEADTRASLPSPLAGEGPGERERRIAAAGSNPRRPAVVSVLFASLWLVALLSLSSCGFKLRGAQQLPFDTLYVATPAESTIGIELARTIRAGTGTRIVEQAKAAAVVLEVITEARDREVLSVNAQGRAREFTLRQRMIFRVHDGKGRDLIGPTPLAASRTLAFNEAQWLAREAEEAQLFREMQTDLVQQILRRLSVLKP